MSWNTRAAAEQAARADAALERLSCRPVREQTLPALLQAAVDLIPTVLPGQIETSVTVLCDDGPCTAASSGPLADDLDESQYDTGSGPCLHAARTGEVVHVPDTLTDQRWPAYARRAAERGALASLSLPLPLDDEERLGVSLNVYARRGYTFAPANRAAAARLAALAGLGARYLTAHHRACGLAAHPVRTDGFPAS
jgi:GAF domain-containing protein